MLNASVTTLPYEAAADQRSAYCSRAGTVAHSPGRQNSSGVAVVTVSSIVDEPMEPPCSRSPSTIEARASHTDAPATSASTRQCSHMSSQDGRSGSDVGDEDIRDGRRIVRANRPARDGCALG